MVDGHHCGFILYENDSSAKNHVLTAQKQLRRGCGIVDGDAVTLREGHIGALAPVSGIQPLCKRASGHGKSQNEVGQIRGDSLLINEDSFCPFVF